MPARTTFILWFFVAASLALLGTVVGEGLLPGVLLGALLVLISVAGIERLDRDRRRGLIAIFVLAVTLRWIVAAAVHVGVYGSRPGLFAPDELGYDLRARFIADYLAGRIPILPDDTRAAGFVYPMAYAYYLFGHSPLLAKLAMGVAGAWSAILTALIAERLTGSTAVARRAGYWVALFPSLVLWSSLNVKDTPTLLGVQLFLLALLVIRERLRAGALALGGVGLAVVTLHRSYELFFLGIGAMSAFAVSSRRQLLRNLVVGAVVVVGLALIAQGAGAGSAFGVGDPEISSMERLQLVRAGYAFETGSSLDINLVDTSTPFGMALWAPIGLFFFFFGPVPFTNKSIISLASTPEMLMWYALLPSLYRGLRDNLRTRLPQLAPVLAYAVASSLSWGLAITNVGSLYRYRAQVLFLPLILIAADQVRRREARRAQRAPIPVVVPVRRRFDALPPLPARTPSASQPS